jgi:hypothetical protein
VAALAPVAVPVVGDAEGDGLVVTLAQLGEQLRVERRITPGLGVFDSPVGFAEDVDDVAGPGLEAAGAEFGDRAGTADDVGAALLEAGQAGSSSW